ncbi:MAG: hypothetical protein C0518_02225 [Opitutus sp.]|nr:hypothetical protein [Opitutus sp.]
MNLTLTAPLASIAPLCPFHDGAATLDGLLAELGVGECELFDLALDLRSLLADGRDAEACLVQLFRLRACLDGRHYLAFYRVRRWVQRRIVAQVRPDRTAPWITRELPLDAARLDELVNSCLASLDLAGPALPRVRFTFRPILPAS